MSETRTADGRGMILLVVGLLVGSVVTCTVLARVATGDPAFAVEPDYYGKAVRFDQLAAERAASDALGWKLDLVTQELPDHRVLVQATITGADGRRIEGARLHLEAFANARASAQQELDLDEYGGEYQATLTMTRPGLWVLRFRAVLGDIVWVDEVRRDLGTGAR